MEKKVYAVYLKNEQELVKSSSGGAMTALSDAIFEKGGIIIACRYDSKTNSVVFDKAYNKEQRDMMRGSKYISANMKNMIPLLKDEILHNRTTPILFIGTPCQVAAVRLWLNKNNYEDSRIILCDLICHGVPESKLWDEYTKLIKENYQSDIVSITFKNKKNGWIRPSAYAYLKNGVEISLKDYYMIYASNNFMRKNCYSCKYANIERQGDITIGDFWGIEKVNPKFLNSKGTSLVIVNTQKGAQLFEYAKISLEIYESDIESCLQPNLMYPTLKTVSYNDMHTYYNKYGLKMLIEKFIHYGPGNVIIRKIRRKFMRFKYKEK